MQISINSPTRPSRELDTSTSFRTPVAARLAESPYRSNVSRYGPQMVERAVPTELEVRSPGLKGPDRLVALTLLNLMGRAIALDDHLFCRLTDLRMN